MRRTTLATVLLLWSDPGVFEFEKPSFLIKESVGVAQIPVTRANGCDGRVAVHWETTDLTAVSGEDYSGGEGSLVFEHGETAKMIDITIVHGLVRELVHVSVYRPLSAFRTKYTPAAGRARWCSNTEKPPR